MCQWTISEAPPFGWPCARVEDLRSGYARIATGARRRVLWFVQVYFTRSSLLNLNFCAGALYITKMSDLYQASTVRFHAFAEIIQY